MPNRNIDISSLPTEELYDLIDLSTLELLERKEKIMGGLGSVATEAIAGELAASVQLPGYNLPATELADGRLVVIHKEGRIEVDGSAVYLPPTPYRALAVLAVHADKVVDTETLLNKLWGDTPRYAMLRVTISDARKAIGDKDLSDKSTGAIRNIYGVGYIAVSTLESSLGLRTK